MISLFVSREFGISFGLKDENYIKKVLETVNATRTNYLSEFAARKLQNESLKKPDLESDPCYREFHYGKARKGYWDGDHIALQIEDVADLFFALFPKEKFNLVIELDYSQIH